MGITSLFNKRQDYQDHISKMNMGFATAFLTIFGEKGEFSHIGIDSHSQFGRTILKQPIYAVFKAGSQFLPCTIEDLQDIGRALKQSAYSAATHKNMEKQLGLATRDYEAHKPFIAQRAPASPMLRAV